MQICLKVLALIFKTPYYHYQIVPHYRNYVLLLLGPSAVLLSSCLPSLVQTSE